MSENLEYKSQDHQFRSRDEYANAKYDITSQWLAKALASGRQKTVANVGCGSGEYNLRLAATGAKVLACEPETNAFQSALAKAPASGKIQVENIGLEDFTKKYAPVDLLVMHDVLEHIEDESDAVTNISQLVKSGGEAVISVPAYNWLFGYHDVQLGHYRRYTKSRMIELFEKDFTILNSRYYGSFFIPVTLMFSKWMQKPYPVGAVTAKPWKQSLFRAACQLQKALPEPIGTSVLLHLRRN